MIRLLPQVWTKAVVAAALILLLLFAAHQWGRITAWWPWAAERRIERVTRDRDRLSAEAAARREEAMAAGAQTRRVEHAHRQMLELNERTLSAIHESRSAPDANQKLDPDRADRLRGHDRGLCELAPDVCAADAAASRESAGAGGETMRDGGPAADADLG